ncbi:DegT/DnrJ/EryC1/StrS family aminotransferase [Ornithinibacillus californiensis]|uniref:DegT/DnrJ/EryC1/StrS family aminotransferase n=1 Tax=Ornithinibacillus californiensis TaxID=161536 RepID=UPI00064DCF00|nr:aminotransferase class I/II-fold pyridoxal phosphate-dependent enzyme [Ornithinibacillus californiensis]
MSGMEQKYIEEAFQSNWIAPLGPNVDAFEKELAEYVGVKGALAVSSGTAAIHLALNLLGVGVGDKVFCSTLTFIASANPILYQGAEPVFIDSEPETWNMSPEALERALEDAYTANHLPKAVIVVNLYGQSSKMDEIVSICDSYNVPIIEDAAESLGATYRGKQSGTFGKFGVYSFNGNKIITTSGGGMLVSDDAEAIEKARFLATQARDPAPHYQHSVMGYNYRLSNLLAGVGRAQLQVLPERIEKRKVISELYRLLLGELPGVQFLPELDGLISNHWLTVMTLNEEEAGVSVDQLIQALHEEHIESRPVWKPLHLQPLFANTDYYSHQDHVHIAEQLFHTGICLPSGSSLSTEDQLRVIRCIRDQFERSYEIKDMSLLKEYEV